jgi:hypothetical protein
MMTRRTNRRTRGWVMRARMLVVIPALAVPAVVARAQSNLSGQGFGFPSGQFSTRAQGTGGAVGEMDPFSPINPATIGGFPSRILFFQMEPEYRSVSTASGTERTTTARYPVVFGALPVGHNMVVSLSASSLLDRTSTTSFNTTQVINGGQVVPMTTTYRINGGIEDVRFATAWTPAPWVRVGAGIHGITGSNLISLSQSFADSVQFAAFTQQRLLGYHGTAGSVGIQLLSSQVVASASGRFGGSLHLSAEDTLLATANVPSQFGASIAYVGIANSAIAVRTSHENWSSLGSLGSPGLIGVDAWDTSVGGDFAGPKIGDRIIFVRGGYRHRTLPFQASAKTVTENSFSGGMGTGFANGRVLTDLALIRSSRSADLPASEHAWTISFGLSVRP